MSNDSDGLDFLAGVPTMELHGADKSFDDGAEGFSEPLGLVSAGSVGDKDLGLG